MIAVWNQRLEVRGGSVRPSTPFPLQKVQSPSTTWEWTTTIFASSRNHLSTRMDLNPQKKYPNRSPPQRKGQRKATRQRAQEGATFGPGWIFGQTNAQGKNLLRLIVCKACEMKTIGRKLLDWFPSMDVPKEGNLEKLKIISWFRLPLFPYEFGASPDSTLFTFTCINTNNLLCSSHNFQLNKWDCFNCAQVTMIRWVRLENMDSFFLLK